MLGHIGVNVPDLSSAKHYYDRVMPLLSFESFVVGDGEFAYRPAASKPGTYLFFYQSAQSQEYSGLATGLQHLAFIVPTRSAVRAAHQLALDLGSEVVHEPQVWAQYPPPYFATFWRDPFGIMLEAVCHRDRD
jgi:catechol 2,3-dioxygenase-like lactoylglutathione lyase family enzyme